MDIPLEIERFSTKMLLIITVLQLFSHFEYNFSFTSADWLQVMKLLITKKVVYFFPVKSIVLSNSRIKGSFFSFDN